MTDGRLIPCSTCARHVRSSEAACPFCSAAVPVTPAQPLPLSRSAGKRLSRAALFALGTSAAAVGACSSVAMYGAPVAYDPSDAADAGDAADADDAAKRPEGGTPAPVYGAPPP